jgi:hypothetical protein
MICFSDHALVATAGHDLCGNGRPGHRTQALRSRLPRSIQFIHNLFVEIDSGMDLINKAENWAKRNDILTAPRLRKELRAYVKDALSYFFFKKGKSVAALGYANQVSESTIMNRNIHFIFPAPPFRRWKPSKRWIWWTEWGSVCCTLRPSTRRLVTLKSHTRWVLIVFLSSLFNFC